MMFSSRFGQTNDRISLTSPTMKFTLDQATWLTFSYYLQDAGHSQSSQLEVRQTSKWRIPGPSLKNISGTDAGWQTAQVCLSPGDLYLIFIVTQGDPHNSDAAIDEINVDSSNPCDPIGSNTNMEGEWNYQFLKKLPNREITCSSTPKRTHIAILETHPI